MKDSYVSPDDMRGPVFKLSKAATFFSSLPLAPKNTQTSIDVATLIVNGASANLQAAGVHPFGLAVALGMAMLQIADQENWSADLRQQMLGSALTNFREQTK